MLGDTQDCINCIFLLSLADFLRPGMLKRAKFSGIHVSSSPLDCNSSIHFFTFVLKTFILKRLAGVTSSARCGIAAKSGPL